MTPKHKDILDYSLIKTNRRLTFEIHYQHPFARYWGPDDGDYPKYTARNGVEIISQSRMDIQTNRLWLLGAKENERSGSMVFSDNEKRDAMYEEFKLALNEWCTHMIREISRRRYYQQAGPVRKFSDSDPHAVRAMRIFDVPLESVTPEQRQFAKKALYVSMWDLIDNTIDLPQPTEIVMQDNVTYVTETDYTILSGQVSALKAVVRQQEECIKVYNNCVETMTKLGFSGMPPNVAMAHLAADLKNKEKIVEEVHAWIVCAAIAPPEDLMQNAQRIAEITQPGTVVVDQED